MEPISIQSLYALLWQGKSVAQLATAIQEHGIHGWDRFGRFGKFSATSDVSSEALDGLAVFFNEQLEFFERLETMPLKSYEDMEFVASQSPLEVARDFQSLPIHRLGWINGQLPEMREADSFPPTPLRKRKATSESPTLHVLGALLHALQELHASNKTMRMPSEGQLLEKMLTKFPNTRWISRSTIQNQFSDAKAAFKSTSSPT
jgi:hypothetical protein